MAGPVTISGFGSGLDINSIVTSLVKANSDTLNALTSRATLLQSATSTLSDISRALGTLQTAADALSTVNGITSMKATSSDGAVVASAASGALPTSLQVTVESLAREQKTYSARQSTNGALGKTGTITVGVAGQSQSLDVQATDSLDDIAAKINGLGLRATASVLYDGTGYRLQIRGLDTGAANALTLTENGTGLDLNGNGKNGNGDADPTAGNTVQAATDAVLYVDSFRVTRPTNQITGVAPGVTLALTAETTKPVTVSVGSDPTVLQSRLGAVASAYNAVVNAIHKASGYGTVTASNKVLAGDSALRSVADRLAAAVTKTQGSGAYQTLASIGLSVDRTGLMTFDGTKLTDALSKDPSSVSALLARPVGATSGGIMADLEDAVKAMTDTTTGVLATRQSSFTSQVKSLNDRASHESDRLLTYEDQLRKQFSAMDSAMAANNTLLSTITNLFKTSSS
jgi:flagellar hook-associated protein 2